MTTAPSKLCVDEQHSACRPGEWQCDCSCHAAAEAARIDETDVTADGVSAVRGVPAAPQSPPAGSPKRAAGTPTPCNSEGPDARNVRPSQECGRLTTAEEVSPMIVHLSINVEDQHQWPAPTTTAYDDGSFGSIVPLDPDGRVVMDGRVEDLIRWAHDLADELTCQVLMARAGAAVADEDVCRIFDVGHQCADAFGRPIPEGSAKVCHAWARRQVKGRVAS